MFILSYFDFTKSSKSCIIAIPDEVLAALEDLPAVGVGHLEAPPLALPARPADERVEHLHLALDGQGLPADDHVERGQVQVLEVLALECDSIDIFVSP